jgi:hypothetical protein
VQKLNPAAPIGKKPIVPTNPYFSELVSNLDRGELEALAGRLRKTQTPLNPPCTGARWKLIGMQGKGADFPPGISIRELARQGKVRIVGNRWSRLFQLVVRWRKIEPGAPRGIAAQNALKKTCAHGHPLSGDNLKLTKTGSRCCKTCSREAAKRSKEKARRKLAALIGPSPIARKTPLTDREIARKYL